MQQSDYTVSTCVKEGSWPAGSPAMGHNGSVSSPPLYHQHLLNDVNDGTGGGAQTLRVQHDIWNWVTLCTWPDCKNAGVKLGSRD